MTQFMYTATFGNVHPSILFYCLHTLIHNGNTAMSQPSFCDSAFVGPSEPRIGLLAVGLQMVAPETEKLNRA
jgi:hypothetical protein